MTLQKKVLSVGVDISKTLQSGSSHIMSNCPKVSTCTLPENGVQVISIECTKDIIFINNKIVSYEIMRFVI